MSHFNRPVKTDIALVVAYPHEGYATLHAQGCSHTKGGRTDREARPFVYDPNDQYEDWYEVAPCAAAKDKGKGRICTRFGAAACDC